MCKNRFEAAAEKLKITAALVNLKEQNVLSLVKKTFMRVKASNTSSSEILLIILLYLSGTVVCAV